MVNNAYQSNYTGEEIDALLDKAKDSIILTEISWDEVDNLMTEGVYKVVKMETDEPLIVLGVFNPYYIVVSNYYLSEGSEEKTICQVRFRDGETHRRFYNLYEEEGWTEWEDIAQSIIPIEQGGTGATTAADARTNLGVASQADMDKIANNTTLIKGTNGGFAGGYYASVKNGGGAIGDGTTTTSGCSVGMMASSVNGGAVGYQTSTDNGGSVGANAESDSGGAVGELAKTGAGFAGGYNAQTIDADDMSIGIDAIQLGTGTNNSEKTLQVYDYQLMDADGNIPEERLGNLPDFLTPIYEDEIDNLKGTFDENGDGKVDFYAVVNSSELRETIGFTPYLLLVSPTWNDGYVQYDTCQIKIQDGKTYRRYYAHLTPNKIGWTEWSSDTVGDKPKNIPDVLEYKGILDLGDWSSGAGSEPVIGMLDSCKSLDALAEPKVGGTNWWLIYCKGYSSQPCVARLYFCSQEVGDGSYRREQYVFPYIDTMGAYAVNHLCLGYYFKRQILADNNESDVWGEWTQYPGEVTSLTTRVKSAETMLDSKQDKDTIVTEAANNTLVLEENQDARLGETSSLVLSMPESIGDWYRSTFSFQSGENATSLVYGYTPLDWKGDDVTSDGRFVPEPFSTYEVDVKNLGVNGIRARVDKIAGYSSVDVEGTVLALPSSAGKALRDYKIYGNSVQNGEPTEETPVAIQSVGNYNGETGKYDVPIVVRGSNVFNKDGGNFIEGKGLEVIETGIRAYNYNTSVMYAADILKPNTTYYVHSDKIYSEEQKNATGRLTWNKGNGTVIMLGEGQTDNTFTTPDTIQGKITAYGFIGNTDYSKYVDFTNLYIGVVPYSEYQPYREPVTSTISLEEPLRKVGDVADYIDYKTALGSHLVTERALTGNESWTHVADGNYFKLALSREANTSAMESSLCSHYVYGDSALDQSFWIDGTEQALCIKDSRFTNEDEFKAWLQSVEVCVIYPTALATGELIKLPAIDTELYDNVITVDTEIQPSNVKVTYFKKG